MFCFLGIIVFEMRVEVIGSFLFSFILMMKCKMRNVDKFVIKVEMLFLMEKYKRVMINIFLWLIWLVSRLNKNVFVVMLMELMFLIYFIFLGDRFYFMWSVVIINDNILIFIVLNSYFKLVIFSSFCWDIGCCFFIVNIFDM